jgi:hypothetical protein
MDYYSAFDQDKVLITWLSIIIVALLNHVVYLFEHRRPNNYIGRSIHVAIFLLFLFLLRRTSNYFVGGEFIDGQFNPAELILDLIGYAVLILLFELLVALLKRTLTLFKWRIL